MTNKPPIERRGAKLTPGERFLNWCNGVAKVWPVILALLAALGYSNKDHIQSWMPGIAEADGTTEITATPTSFRQQVEKFSVEIREELIKIKSEAKAINSRLSKQDQTNYTKLISKVDSIDARLVLIEGVVQP